MCFNLKKKAKKWKTHGKSKRKNSKPKKNRKQHKWEKKRTSKRGKNWKNMDLSICMFVAFFLLFRFAFLLLFFALILLFVCFFPGKKQKITIKKQIEKAKKSNKHARTSPFFPIFSPFCLSFLFPFFSLLFCFCVFWILLICFLVFPLFLHFSRIFSSFKKIRISYGLVNIRIDDNRYMTSTQKTYL